MTNPVAKVYDAKKIEDYWYARWMKSGHFSPHNNKDASTYTVVIPPPNVTGVLHMGHALNVAVQDVLIRYHRMKGKRVLWIPGTDHAGIATQNVVERALKEEGLSKEELGRESFIQRVWQWKKLHGGQIIKQLKKLGASCDWTKELFTMEPLLCDAVRKCFYELYQKKLIYRGQYITNTCPRCQTALSDEECERKMVKGCLYYICYPVCEGDRFIEIATTRPETIWGDVCIVRNPTDSRYHNLKGHSVVVPLANRKIPILEDAYVDPQFGSGLLKITPAHDPNDFLLGKKHRLPFLDIMTLDGKMKDSGRYTGMDRMECRKQLVNDLKEKKFLVKIENHHHEISHCYRCSSIIEPRVSKQWFVKMECFSKRALDVQKKGEINFYSKRWEGVYTHWLNNSRDWCISRQIWWGHRIPVWYCQECDEEIVMEQDPKDCPSCNSKKIVQDSDVLDTWFSSWLWPLTALGWPKKKEDLDNFYPTQVLVTGSDILYFWVARMIIAGLEFQGKVPFSDIYLHGIIRDDQGRKMSKSLKNVVDPLSIIEEFSADSLRFSLLLLSLSNQDIRIAKDTFLLGYHFSNKIWNVFRYLKMNAIKDKVFSIESTHPYDLLSAWILSRLMRMIDRVNLSLEKFRFQDASQAIYDFVWHDFCDWYLELIKDEIVEEETQRYSLAIFERFLRVLHPFMPFITEEIWQKLPILRKKEFLMISQWPLVDFSKINIQIEETFKMIQTLVQSIRRVRKDLGLAFSKKLEIVIVCKDKSIKKQLKEFDSLFKKIAGVSVVEFLSSFQKKECRVIVFSYGSVYVRLAGLIDIAIERKRLQNLLEKQRKENFIFAQKLSNKIFLKRAPRDVIEKFQKKKDYLAFC